MHRAVKAALVAGAASLVTGAAAQAAPGDYVKHRVIVKYAPGTSSSERTAAARSAGVLERLGTVAGAGARVVRVRGDAVAAAARLNRSSAVLYAEPDLILHALATPNDPRFGELYGIHNPNDADLDGPEGWDLAGLGAFPSTGGPLVGIVDTGIDSAHEDLAGKTAVCGGVTSFGILGLLGGNPAITDGSKCTDDNDHGSHVAGTIAAIANNAKGVAGVAFNSRLAICKALSSGGSGSTTGVANCITYLRNKGAKVISMSLGGGASTTLQQAVQGAYAGGNGALIVAAAGNDGNATLNYPAAYPEAVSVAATDSNDHRASFSNANSDVEVAAAGVNVLSVKRGGGYVAFSGTSMATPHASGVAALIWGKFPGLNAAGVRSRLDAGVDDLGAPGRDPSFGFGRVTLTKALP
ncbi:MAG TPA: S8 family serine peptidase [Thermoleophilaceae bacterium]|nr:S8 family serine peptidase [Thermoleophilaceae bacterium]